MKYSTKIKHTDDGKMIFEARWQCELKFNKECIEDYESIEAHDFAHSVALPEIEEIYKVGILYIDNNYYLKFYDKDYSYSVYNNNVDTYHCDIGTIDGYRYQAFGLRRVLAIRFSGVRSQRIVIVFGRDMVRDKD